MKPLDNGNLMVLSKSPALGAASKIGDRYLNERDEYQTNT
jgi:hypothetical protein